MSRKYSIHGEAISNDPAAPNSLLTLVSAATIRPEIFEVIVGCSAAPADNAARYHVQRFTAAGTSAASPPTPQALDPADPGPLATAGHNHSADPTYTAGAILLQLPANQRVTARWLANPGCELKAPATAANGLGLRCAAGSAAFNVDPMIHFYE